MTPQGAVIMVIVLVIVVIAFMYDKKRQMAFGQMLTNVSKENMFVILRIFTITDILQTTHWC